MNQCGLTATALKQVGDPLWMSIRDAMRAYLEHYDYYGAAKLRNYFYPIIDSAVVPLGPAFKSNDEQILHDTGVNGDDTHPRQIILHTEPTDPLSDTCGNIALNRALMRALHHWKIGQTSTANTCYDYVIANRRPQGWHLADSTDFVPASEGSSEYIDEWKYRSYKQFIHWIAAKDMGRSRLHTDILDVLQNPDHGGVTTFYKNNYNYIDWADHNTETTALAVIADVRWNPP